MMTLGGRTATMLAICNALLMFSSIVWGQDSSCTTLYNHGDRDVIVCHAGDTYTRTNVNSQAASQETISADTYNKLMAQDAADLRAHTAQVAAANKTYADSLKTEHAPALTRKECKDVGGKWQHGVCSVKGDK